MKRALLAAACLGAFTAQAQAQSNVTLWGNVTGGVTYAHTTGKGGVLAFADSKIAPTAFGLRGTEDLGGGLKAGFNLTAGFNTSKGAFDNQAAGTFFGREANVSLSSALGTIKLGKQFDPAFLAAIATEPRGMAHSMSMIAPWIGATATNNIPLSGGIFDANAISYTYSGNGLYLGVLRTLGEQQSSMNKRSGTAVGATYSIAGFTASGGYTVQKGNGLSSGNTDSQVYGAGLGYAAGPFAIRAQFNDFKSQWDGATGGKRVRAVGVGADYATSSNNKLNLAYYHMSDVGLGGRTQTVALMDTYNFSPRTSIYGQAGLIFANSAASNSPGGSGFDAYKPTNSSQAAAGTKTYLVGVGLNHKF